MCSNKIVSTLHSNTITKDLMKRRAVTIQGLKLMESIASLFEVDTCVMRCNALLKYSSKSVLLSSWQYSLSVALTSQWTHPSLDHLACYTHLLIVFYCLTDEKNYEKQHNRFPRAFNVFVVSDLWFLDISIGSVISSMFSLYFTLPFYIHSQTYVFI